MSLKSSNISKTKPCSSEKEKSCEKIDHGNLTIHFFRFSVRKTSYLFQRF